MADADEYGPQYDKDDAFKARARLHQSRFRRASLGLGSFATYGNRLGKDDALAGRNFYGAWDGLFAAVQTRYPLGYNKLYWDMLRSEHIPFNLFVLLREEPALAGALLSHWLSEDVASTGVEIEWAPSPKKEFLDDNTSFDAFLTYDALEGTKGAVGVEVKYTEGESSRRPRPRRRPTPG